MANIEGINFEPYEEESDDDQLEDDEELEECLEEDSDEFADYQARKRELAETLGEDWEGLSEEEIDERLKRIEELSQGEEEPDPEEAAQEEAEEEQEPPAEVAPEELKASIERGKRIVEQQETMVKALYGPTLLEGNYEPSPEALAKADDEKWAEHRRAMKEYNERQSAKAEAERKAQETKERTERFRSMARSYYEKYGQEGGYGFTRTYVPPHIARKLGLKKPK